MKQRSSVARWWLDLPIRQKGLLVVTLPLVTLALTTLIRMPFARQQQETTALLARAHEAREAVQSLLLDLLDLEIAMRGAVLRGKPVSTETFEQSRAKIHSRHAVLASYLVNPTDAAALEEATTLVNRELTLTRELVDLVGSGHTLSDPAIQERLANEQITMARLRTVLHTFTTNHDVLVAQSQAELEDATRWLRPVILLVLVGGLASALVAARLFATGIARRLTALERNAERLAKGERLVYEPSRGTDEIGSLDNTLRRASVLLRGRDRELRKLNEELRRTVHDQALLNRELEAFSYSVSHDLRAPLRSIDGFAQALREDWGDRLDEAGQSHLSRVRNAAQRMGRLIDDLLKLSRLTRAQVQRMDVDLSRVAREVAAELTARNPSRDVTWDIEDGLHAWCDPALARILLDNLLGNAWKFTSKTAGARIQLASVPDSRPTVFIVKDNGAGFDMRYVEKLFSPFQRLHGERDFPGTGIGLATVQRVVHKHGGQVTTEAEVGRGATFSFTLAPAVTGMTALAS